MKKSILLALVFVWATGVFAQYKKMFHKTVTVENDEVKITLDDIVTTEKEAKFKFKLFNKTNNYLIVKPEEFVINVGGKEYKPAKEKEFVVKPNDESPWGKVINFVGAPMDKNGYTATVKGVYKIDPNSPSVTAPDFKIPPSTNDFKAGPFSVTCTKCSKKTDRTDVKFECVYEGTKIGFFEPKKVGVKMPDGKEFANYHGDKSPSILNKGLKDDFTVSFKDIPTSSGDMQKVDMIILWRDAFKEITPVASNPVSIKVEFDEETSNAKGK